MVQNKITGEMPQAQAYNSPQYAVTPFRNDFLHDVQINSYDSHQNFDTAGDMIKIYRPSYHLYALS
jgi:hypothetical protein